MELGDGTERQVGVSDGSGHLVREESHQLCSILLFQCCQNAASRAVARHTSLRYYGRAQHVALLTRNEIFLGVDTLSNLNMSSVLEV